MYTITITLTMIKTKVKNNNYYYIAKQIYIYIYSWLCFCFCFCCFLVVYFNFFVMCSYRMCGIQASIYSSYEASLFSKRRSFHKILWNICITYFNILSFRVVSELSIYYWNYTYTLYSSKKQYELSLHRNLSLLQHRVWFLYCWCRYLFYTIFCIKNKY